MKLSQEDLLILSYIKINPSLAELEQINDLIPRVKDWNYLTKKAIEHQAGPLLYKKLPLLSNHKMIPAKVLSDLKQSWLKTLSRSMVLIEHFKLISEAFKAEDIPFIALKGILLSDWLYREIGLRQFSDMDLLVKEEDGQRCIDILEDMGYLSNDFDMTEFVKKNTDIVHYNPLVKNGVSVEIHIKIHGNSELYNVNVVDLWKNSKPVVIHGLETLKFDINDLLLHVCLHLDKHFCIGRTQFTGFYDITNLLTEHSTEIDWDLLKKDCIRYKASDHVYPYILLCAKYFNAPIPVSVRKEYSKFLNGKINRIFIRYMKEKMSINYTSYLLRSIKGNANFINSIHYLFDIVFPSRKFMIRRYQIRKESLFFLYYPIRLLIGLKYVFTNIVNSLR